MATHPPAVQTASLPQFRIVNETRGIELAFAAEVADTAARRSKGLLGRDGLQPGGALWIVPCEAVHTFWMRFPLDLVYLNKSHRIVKVRRNVGPWRISACLRAHSVIEFASGSVHDENACPGDLLSIQPVYEVV